MKVSDENATPPKSTKSRNLISSVHFPFLPFFLLSFEPQDTQKSGFSILVDFGSVAISVKTVIQYCRSTKPLLMRDLPYGRTLLRISGHCIELYSYLDGLEVTHRNPHAHMYTRVSTRTRKHTHAHTHIHIHTYTHTPKMGWRRVDNDLHLAGKGRGTGHNVSDLADFVQVQCARAGARTHARTHALTHALTSSLSLVHTHAHTLIHVHTKINVALMEQGRCCVAIYN